MINYQAIEDIVMGDEVDCDALKKLTGISNYSDEQILFYCLGLLRGYADGLQECESRLEKLGKKIEEIEF